MRSLGGVPGCPPLVTSHYILETVDNCYVLHMVHCSGPVKLVGD